MSYNITTLLSLGKSTLNVVKLSNYSVYCTHFFHWYMQLVLRWMDPQQHQDCRLRHPAPWFENGCYFHWKHNCHSRIVQAHQRTIHRYVQAQGNKIIEWDFFFLVYSFLYCVCNLKLFLLLWQERNIHLQVGIFCHKVHIFWEGHKIFRNLPLTFDYSTYSQK